MRGRQKSNTRKGGLRYRLRVQAFWALVALMTLLYAFLAPAIWLPRRIVSGIVNSYLAAVFFLARRLLKVNWGTTGAHHVGAVPVLVAAKHQSILETLVLQYVLDDPVIVLKKELLELPLFGWVLRRLGHIGIDREGGMDAARKLRDAAMSAHSQGRTVVIFPEGTRRDTGAAADYKGGVDLLYALLKCPCVPVAVNSGRLFKAKALTPAPGHVTVEFLPAIPPGLPRVEFAERLKGDIELATMRLLHMDDVEGCQAGG